MADLNSVCLTGRVVRDAELRFTSSGIAIGKFTLAVNGVPKAGSQPEAMFVDCVTWRKTAEVASQFCLRGKCVAVSGSLEIRKFVTKDGTNAKAINVNVESLTLLSGGQSNQGGADPARMPAGDYVGSPHVAATPVNTSAENRELAYRTNESADDIPF